MWFFWFVATILFFLLWIVERSKPKATEQKPQIDQYSQGYWDGYREFGDKAKRLLTQDDIASDLAALIEVGERGTEPSQENSSYKEYDQSIQLQGVEEVLVQESQPVLSEEALQATKERDTLKNLNILLYVASFLIVAAAALFVTLVMPASVKLGSLILVTGAFYCSGMLLHARSSRLKPAGTAFVGTALAILPFVGFALTSLGGMSGEVAWLVTSLIGLGMYGFAAVRLQSQLVSYLTMAFVLSLALSTVSTLGVAVLWYFIAIIGVSLLCNSLYILWPHKLPSVFMQPVEQTGQVATPIALVASLFVMSSMELYMYQVLYGVATAHYLVVWLERREFIYEQVVRVLAHITLLLVAVDLSQLMSGATESRVEFGLWALALAAAQVGYSLVRARPDEGTSRSAEQVWIGAMTTLIACGMLYWVGTEHVAQLTAVSLTTIGLTALGAMLRFRQVGWAYVGLFVSVVLPFVVLRWAMEPALSYEVIAGGFVLLSLLAMMGLDRANNNRSSEVCTMWGVATAVYAGMVASCGLLSSDGLVVSWTMLLAAGLFVGLSYVARVAYLEILGAVLGVIAVAAGVGETDLTSEWKLVATVVIASALLALGVALHHARGERQRRNALVVVMAFVGALLVFAVSGSNEAVQRVATSLLLLAALVGVAGRALCRERGVDSGMLLQTMQAAYLVYPFLAMLVAWQAGEGWFALTLAVYTGLLWLCSYIEKLPWMMLAGNVLLVWTIATLWAWLQFSREWQFFGVVWLASAVVYSQYWIALARRDVWRQWAALGSIWVLLGVAAFTYVWFGQTQFVMAAAGSLLAGAVLLGVQGYIDKRPSYIESAAYIATFAVQRMVSLLIPETNIVVYGHWWAITIALVAAVRHEGRQLRAIIALGFVTASTGVYALAGQAGYSLVFLIEHLIILTVGALLRQSWAMWWGLVATVVAVLYFLRDYTFVAPLFLGILLLIFVVWRLSKMGKSKD